MPFSTVAKNQMLDAHTADRLSLHNGDPGPAGANNEIAGGGYSRQACAFNAAAGGARALSANVPFTGTPGQAVTHVGIWLNAGTVFKGSQALTGDAAFNAAGEYTVTAAGTSLTLSDA